MKAKLFFLLFMFGMLMSSCNSSDMSEDIATSKTHNDVEVTDTIAIITLKKTSNTFNKSNRLLTRAITNYDGVTQGKPEMIYRRQKVYLSGIPGLPRGVYFADIYETSGFITIPNGYNSIEFDLSGDCGYSDWRSREEGLIQSIIQTKKAGIITNKVRWSFYTMEVVLNSAGQMMSKVLPKDGAKINIPYKFTNK
ncbi:MAG: hypothetical protein SPI30_03470 [Prevotella sp.]|nr:hypothetical protein [Prevotella sp.]